MESRRRQRFKWIVLGLAVVGSLLAVEAVFRYRAWQHNHGSLESAFVRQPPRAPSGRTRFYDLIQPHQSDRLIYELRPNLKAEFQGQTMTTNRFGFRMPEVEVEADPGTITIVGLGASIMWGHGVADGENFLAVLGRALRERHPERGWRVINTAVPSYNVVMKVETLKLKGLQFRPDLVVLGIASNNLDLPEYVRVEEDPFDPGRSFLLDWFRERRGIEEEIERRYSVLAAVDRRKLSWDGQAVTDPQKIPERYRGLVGWPPFHVALDELERLGREHHFPTVVVTHLDYDLVGPMLDECRKRGMETVLVQDDIDAFIQRRYGEPFSIERFVNSELVVNQENVHPSALLHRMIGKRLADELESRGIIDALMRKAPAAAAATGGAVSGTGKR